MIRKPVLLILTASLPFLSGCAAQNRCFSRKDYSEMQDPFMESDALASRDAAKGEKQPSDTAARARLDDFPSEKITPEVKSAFAQSQAPGSVRKAGDSFDAAARTGRIESASYPGEPTDTAAATTARAGNRAYQGPALSDFLSRRQAEAVSSKSQTVNELSRAVSESANGANRSPAARAAMLPDLDDETAGFNDFLQKKTDTVNAKTQKVADTVKQSNESVEDFASWAAQEKQKWGQEGAKAVSAAAAIPTAAKQEAQAVAKQVRETADNAVVDFNSQFDESASFDPGASFEENTTARPLLKRYEDPAPEFESDSFEAARAKEDAFDNPFDVLDNETAPAATKEAAASGASRGSLDSSFQLDSGWRPSNLQR